MIAFIHSIGDSDYESTPVPSVLTIQRGQERMCSNITINNDMFIETNETFTLSLITESTNFSAGVTLTPDSSTVVILDNDGGYGKLLDNIYFLHSYVCYINL